MVGLIVLASVFSPALLINPAEAQKVSTIAVMMPNGGDPYFQAKGYGYEMEAKKPGVNLIYYDAGGYAFTSKQIAQIEDVIQRKVEGIVFTGTSSTATVPVIKKAIKAGMHVLIDNVPVRTPMVKAMVMKND